MHSIANVDFFFFMHVGRALRMFARITSLSLIATFTGQAVQGGFVT
jgi:hypothetical protein